MVCQGIDPIAAREAKRQAAMEEAAKSVTFKWCAEQYINAKKQGWRNAKNAKQWPSTLDAYVYPTIGALSVGAVDTGLVMSILTPIWSTIPPTANKVRGRIESILNWAASNGYRQGENPARWRGHLENLLAEPSKIRQEEHHDALPYAEIGKFMATLRDRKTTVSTKALELVILTACRTTETIEAKWQEIDWKKREWTLPAERTKTKKTHVVPLSDDALALLEDRKAVARSEFVL